MNEREGEIAEIHTTHSPTHIFVFFESEFFLFFLPRQKMPLGWAAFLPVLFSNGLPPFHYFHFYVCFPPIVVARSGHGLGGGAKVLQ